MRIASPSSALGGDGGIIGGGAGMGRMTLGAGDAIAMAGGLGGGIIGSGAWNEGFGAGVTATGATSTVREGAVKTIKKVIPSARATSPTMAL